jgi:predicted transcriptional regulator of viral defense system
MRWMPHHRFGDIIAACLWAGPETAAASLESALVVHDLSDAMPTKIHITVPHRFTGQRDGVVVHVAPLPARDRVTVDDVPVTSVARTLADVAKRTRRSLLRPPTKPWPVAWSAAARCGRRPARTYTRRGH